MTTFWPFSLTEGMCTCWLEPQKGCIPGGTEARLIKVLHVGAQVILLKVGSALHTRSLEPKTLTGDILVMRLWLACVVTLGWEDLHAGDVYDPVTDAWTERPPSQGCVTAVLALTFHSLHRMFPLKCQL